jgi:hypothetical protein
MAGCHTDYENLWRLPILGRARRDVGMKRVFRACDDLGDHNRQREIEDPKEINKTEEHRVSCGYLLWRALIRSEL